MIWVELLSRHHQVTARYRHDGASLLLGRAYRNDVVIDDPTVAPEHLRITQTEDGTMTAETLSPEAKLIIAGRAVDRAIIDGDTELRIGHTLLRIRGADYAVPAAVAAPAQSEPWLALAIGVGGALCLNGLTLWLNETAEPKASRYVAAMVGFAVVVLVWAALWALVSRIFSGQARFIRHLAIGFCGLFAYSIYVIIAEAFAFSLSSPFITAYVFLGIWVFFGIVCFLQLQVISPTRVVLKSAIVVLMVAAAITVQLTNQFDQRRNGAAPPVASTTFPPAFRLARPESEDQFFASVAQMKKTLDADRASSATTVPTSP